MAEGEVSTMKGGGEVDDRNGSQAGTVTDVTTAPLVPPSKYQGDEWREKVKKAVEVRRQMQGARRDRRMEFSTRREYSAER